MTRGRKPKPTYMKVLEGGAGNAAADSQEPVVEKKLDSRPPPAHLTEVQQALWNEVMREAPKGMLTMLDESTLETWVVARAAHREAQKRVTSLGLLIKGASGIPYQNPYLAIMNKQAAIMLRAAAEMGFTPSSRSRVKIDPRKNKPPASDPFGDLKSLSED